MQPAFWLALSSGFAHALWNALAKTPGLGVLFCGVAIFGLEQLL